MSGEGEARSSKALTCGICPRTCRLAPGATGFCGARANTGERIEALCYGRAAALALDPIEKKPFARFHPGSHILSWGGWGCNLRCPFCQNSSISLEFDEARGAAATCPPDELVRLAAELKSRGSIGIAFTYNEPATSLEFLLDGAKLAHEAGLVTCLVTNGYVCEGPWTELMEAMDAVNIDLKGFSAAYYAGLGAPDGLDVVKHSVELAATRTHLEVTTLVVPGPTDAEPDGALPANDSPEEIDALASWLAGVSPEIPLHLTRFWPRYRLSMRPPTNAATTRRLAAVARRHLRFVYA